MAQLRSVEMTEHRLSACRSCCRRIFKVEKQTVVERMLVVAGTCALLKNLRRLAVCVKSRETCPVYTRGLHLT